MKNLTLLLFILYCFPIISFGQANIPKVQKGILDLRNYDFEKEGYLKLDGNWEFVYDKWLSSKELDKIKKKSYIEIPSVWNGFDWKGEKLSGQGIVTYRLTILLNYKKPLALKIPPPSTAYELYINGKLEVEQGKIGKNYEDTKTSNENRLVEVANPKDTLEIILHIANFHHRKGGIWASIDLGTEKEIYELRQKNLLFDVFLLGSLLIMAFYHLGFFLMRRKDVTSIYFSLFCFVVFVRILSVGERFILSLVPLSWELTTKLEYISFYMALSTGVMFIKSLYPADYSRLIQKITLIFSFIATLITIVTPAIIHSNLVPFFQILVLLLGLYTIAILILAAIRKREGAWIFVGGFLAVIIAIFNDILHYSYVINTFEAVPLGVFVFFFAQSLVLSQRFSRTFTKVENLTKTLGELNQNLEKKVIERTEKVSEQKEKIEAQHVALVKVNDNIRASINYARRIQQSILPKEEDMKQYFEDMFILYRPKDIVSGDFYWFSQTQYKIIIAAVDCTGHGIPGGFMSMIGNDLLEEIVNLRKIYEPDKILQELKRRINEVLRQKDTGNQDGMDISICTIDHYPEYLKEMLGEPKLTFAGANNPVIYFQNGKLNRLKANKIMIGGYNPLEKESIFTSQSISLDQETTAYLFSDGYHDQFGGENKRKFMRSRFRELLAEIHKHPMEKQKEILDQTFIEWTKGHKQIDDILVIGLRL